MKIHTKFENVVNPFTEDHFREIREMTQKRGKKCAYCTKKKLVYRQYSPDLGFLYFCSIKCNHLFERENTYRAMSVERIKRPK